MKFLLFMLMLVLLFVALGAFFVYGKLKELRRQFRQEESRPGRSRQGDGQAVTDTRSAEEVGRKIIADDEGEYVEYEEV